MTSEQVARGTVDAVVAYDGRVLLTHVQGGWKLPSGDAEPAESAPATAARVVYELTGYLVDGTTLLPPAETATARPAVVCQLLSESPSADAQLGPDDYRWAAIAEAITDGLPEAVRTYLQGHTPV